VRLREHLTGVGYFVISKHCKARLCGFGIRFKVSRLQCAGREVHLSELTQRRGRLARAALMQPYPHPTPLILHAGA